MKIKVEKTASGKVKAVVLKKKKVNYGIVEEREEPYKHEGEYTAPKKSEEPPIDPKMTHAGGSGEGEQLGAEMTEQADSEPYEASVGESTENESEESTETVSYTEALKEQIEKQSEKEQKKVESKKEESFNLQEAINSLMKSMSEEYKEKAKEKKEAGSESKKKMMSKNDVLSEYLLLNLQLKALSELLKAVKVAKGGKVYYSFVAVEGKGIEVIASSPAKEGIIFDFDTFPWFETEEQAKAFLELCAPIINRYCHLMSHLNAIAVIQANNIEVYS